MLQKPLPEEYVCEISTDQQYLNQYYLIREYAYRLDLGLQNFSGGLDTYDEVGDIIIVRRGHFCLGGSRINISRIESPSKLPFEDDDFNIKSFFPTLSEHNYCELGRTAILPQYRNGEYLNAMFAESAELALKNNCSFLMGVSPAIVIRRFKNCFQNLGYEVVIFDEVIPPHKAIHEDLRLKFGMVSLVKGLKVPEPSITLKKQQTA